MSLVRAGYDVVLIAPADRDELFNGVRIVHLPRERRRLLRMTRQVVRLFRKALAEKGDIYHFHDPELILVGMMLRVLGKQVVYDVHEDVPRQVLSKSYLRRWQALILSKAIALLEWLMTRAFFSRVVAATPSIARRFPKRRTTIVQNFPMVDESAGSRAPHYDNRKHLVTYVGCLDQARGIRESVLAIERVTHQDCRMVLAGQFSAPKFEAACRELKGWGKVDYRGWQPRDEVQAIFRRARAGLVLFHPVPNHLEAYPNKLFEYMAAGIPVIASDFPLWRRIIEEADCGLLVDPLNPEDIAGAIDWVFSHAAEAEQLGANGRTMVHARYNWAREERKLVSLYKTLDS